MMFRSPSPAIIVTALIAYAALAGVVGLAQSARRREARVQRWYDAFRGVPPHMNSPERARAAA